MKGRNDRFTISIYLLPLFLAVFLTACEVRDSYMKMCIRDRARTWPR